MPIYDYMCTNCGHRMEVMHGVHDSGPGACPVCGGPLRKLISPTAIHFRGSGWAKKDRASSSGGSKSSSSGSGAGSGTNANGASSGESGGSERKATGGSAADSGGSSDKSEGTSSTKST